MAAIMMPAGSIAAAAADEPAFHAALRNGEAMVIDCESATGKLRASEEKG
jgi:hypothetical protein